MATLIKFKRKKSGTVTGVKLQAGEPFYDLRNKHFYIGNESDEEISSTKKHIAEVTDCGTYYQIGEDTDNKIPKSNLKWQSFKQNNQ